MNEGTIQTQHFIEYYDVYQSPDSNNKMESDSTKTIANSKRWFIRPLCLIFNIVSVKKRRKTKTKKENRWILLSNCPYPYKKGICPNWFSFLFFSIPSWYLIVWFSFYSATMIQWAVSDVVCRMEFFFVINKWEFKNSLKTVDMNFVRLKIFEWKGGSELNDICFVKVSARHLFPLFLFLEWLLGTMWHNVRNDE